MPLTDIFAKNIKHRGAVAGDKHTDGGGMYLLVNAGGKYWRMNCRFDDKRKTLALGVYLTAQHGFITHLWPKATFAPATISSGRRIMPSRLGYGS